MKWYGEGFYRALLFHIDAVCANLILQVMIVSEIEQTYKTHVYESKRRLTKDHDLSLLMHMLMSNCNVKRVQQFLLKSNSCLSCLTGRRGYCR